MAHITTVEVMFTTALLHQGSKLQKAVFSRNGKRRPILKRVIWWWSLRIRCNKQELEISSCGHFLIGTLFWTSDLAKLVRTYCAMLLLIVHSHDSCAIRHTGEFSTPCRYSSEINHTFTFLWSSLCYYLEKYLKIYGSTSRHCPA